ncbi:MAG: copper amine oxidase N-terminal domain-containing protein, partial [Peptococcaceae bacterium]|nr:copper amine oxidase N-terminal domain-containing protein [Peptococcaceae bacterium]
GRTYVPLRFVSEALGGVVDWNQETRTASVNKSGTVILMQIGSKSPTVNGQVKVIDAAAMLMNDRTVVPLRFVSECLGATVEWDEVNRVVNITTASQSPVPEGYKRTKMGYLIPTDTKMEYEDYTGNGSGVNLTLAIVIPRGDLETQFKQAEEILARVHGAQAAKEVIDYARQKTTVDPELEEKRFGKIRVYSERYSTRIYIEVWR